jgi:hypothetical protein
MIGIPMRRPTPILILACFGWGLLASAFAGFARETVVPVHLLAPWGGATLAAGSTAELEWTPGERFAELQEVQEWEAFLSLDGGATYPVRITPHLDQDLRRIRFQVPPLPARDVRILLRFGDETRETAVELPERFAIAAAPGLLPVLDRTLPLAQPAYVAGEPALPGHAGVVAWVEGSRRGGGLRQVVAAEAPSLRSRLAPPEAHGEAAVLAAEPTPPQSPGSVPETGDSAPPAGRRSALSRAGTGPFLRHDILLLIQRQNE